MCPSAIGTDNPNAGSEDEENTGDSGDDKDGENEAGMACYESHSSEGACNSDADCEWISSKGYCWSGSRRRILKTTAGICWKGFFTKGSCANDPDGSEDVDMIEKLIS